jgi:hypothetical protein
MKEPAVLSWKPVILLGFWNTQNSQFFENTGSKHQFQVHPYLLGGKTKVQISVISDPWFWKEHSVQFWVLANLLRNIWWNFLCNSGNGSSNLLNFQFTYFSVCFQTFWGLVQFGTWELAIALKQGVVSHSAPGAHLHLKVLLRQKKNYGNSNIFQHAKIYSSKNPLKETKILQAIITFYN